LEKTTHQARAVESIAVVVVVVVVTVDVYYTEEG
jgi:hypothetical protein